MATTIQIETAVGSGLFDDYTAVLLNDSVSVKFNTIDFALISPSVQISRANTLGALVILTDPAWNGAVTAYATSDPVDLRNSQRIVTLTATNALTLPTDTAPFDLSDVPVAATGGAYLMESGGGHILLESGTDFATATSILLLEQVFSWGYSSLQVQTRTDFKLGNQNHGTCTIQAPGMRPGLTFKLTSLNQGFAAQSFQITQVTTRYQGLAVPVFLIEFGDPPRTFSEWVVDPL